MENPNIKSKSALYKTNRDIYNAAKQIGILNDLFKPRHKKYTKDDLFDYISKHLEIKTKKDLYRQNASLYMFALNSGLINELNFEKISRRQWTKEALYKLLSEHPEIKTRIQLIKQFPGAYHSACELKILDELIEKHQRTKKWSKEAIYKLLNEHPEIKKRYDLMKYNMSCYTSAHNMGILYELFGERKYKPVKWTK